MVPDILFPSAVEASDWGESQEENALPYDQIKRASYSEVGELKHLFERLTQQYQNRIANHPEFGYLRDDINEYKKRKDDVSVSLVASERQSERNEREAKNLKRANERLARLGLEKVENLDDLPDELDDIDPLLEQAAFITMDAMTLNIASLPKK